MDWKVGPTLSARQRRYSFRAMDRCTMFSTIRVTNKKQKRKNKESHTIRAAFAMEPSLHVYNGAKRMKVDEDDKSLLPQMVVHLQLVNIALGALVRAHSVVALLLTWRRKVVCRLKRTKAYTLDVPVVMHLTGMCPCHTPSRVKTSLTSRSLYATCLSVVSFDPL